MCIRTENLNFKYIYIYNILYIIYYVHIYIYVYIYIIYLQGACNIDTSPVPIFHEEKSFI